MPPISPGLDPADREDGDRRYQPCPGEDPLPNQEALLAGKRRRPRSRASQGSALTPCRPCTRKRRRPVAHRKTDTLGRRRLLVPPGKGTPGSRRSSGAYRPNVMGPGAKTAFYAAKVREFVSTTRGNRTPSRGRQRLDGHDGQGDHELSSHAPGVLAAFYLREYAKQGPFVTPCGSPSTISPACRRSYSAFLRVLRVWDRRHDRPPLLRKRADAHLRHRRDLVGVVSRALLTVPVVIVSTEEGPAAIPRSGARGSLRARRDTDRDAVAGCAAGRGARHARPASSSPRSLGRRGGWRAADDRRHGEAGPGLPIDGSFPFVYLERKFMHLGFHIYRRRLPEVRNVEAARPLVSRPLCF